VKKTLTTENTEIHGAKSSVSLCDLCGEKNTHYGEHGDPRSEILCDPPTEPVAWRAFLPASG